MYSALFSSLFMIIPVLLVASLYLAIFEDVPRGLLPWRHVVFALAVTGVVMAVATYGAIQTSIYDSGYVHTEYDGRIVFGIPEPTPAPTPENNGVQWIIP